MKRFISLKIIFIVLFALGLGLFAMPIQWKQKVPIESVKNFLIAQDVSLGIDLAGGTELTMKVDLSDVERRNSDNDETNDVNESAILERLTEKLKDRVDPSGTREIQARTADFGEGKFIIIGLTEDMDIDAAKEELQRDINLEFKEQAENPELSQEERTEATETMANILVELQEVEDFTAKAEALVAAEESEELDYQASETTLEELTQSLDAETANELWSQEPGTIYPEVVTANFFNILERFSVYKVGEKTTVEREIQLSPFKAAQREYNEAEQAEVAISNLPPEAEDAANLLEPGAVSEIIETNESWLLIELLPLAEGEVDQQVNQIVISKETAEAESLIGMAQEAINNPNPENLTATEEVEAINLEEIFINKEISQWLDTGLGGNQFRVANAVTDPQTNLPVVQIEFNQEGAELFGQLTERNVGKPIAIFVGGELVSAPNVNEPITNGIATITLGSGSISERIKEANLLASELNTGAIPAPVSPDAERKIQASIGQEALDSSITAGLIGLLILAAWMILAYRLLGVVAVIALGIYAGMIAFALVADIGAGWSALLAMLLGIGSYISFKEFEKDIIWAVTIPTLLAIFAAVSLTSEIVLTLAGIAGIILSIGMAVDANILIFERIKEELRDGKSYSAALTIGFERAWPSIRDSNVSSLITCLILWLLGTSVVKNFAVTLSLGIILSMFSAITISKTLLAIFVGRKINRKKFLFVSKAN
jgi:protein-export membrane protein SecD